MFQRSADFVLYSSHQAQTPNFSSLLCSVTAFSGALGLHCMCAGIGCGGDDPAQIKDNLPCRLNVIIQNWSTGQRLLNMYMTSFTSSQIKIFYEFSVVVMESIKYTID